MCETDLIVACKNGNYEKVIKLLQQKNSVHIRDKDNATPLYWSVCRDHLQITQVLISAGSDINAQVTWGSTALHAASDRGHINCVKALINSRNCNINIQNERGDTPLHLCSLRGHTAIVKIFLEVGANLFLKNTNGKTPYAEAEGNGYNEAAAILKQRMLDQVGIASFPNNLSKTSVVDNRKDRQNGHRENISSAMSSGVMVTSHEKFLSEPMRRPAHIDNFVRYNNDMTGFHRPDETPKRIPMNPGIEKEKGGIFSANSCIKRNHDLMDKVDGKVNNAVSGRNPSSDRRLPQAHDESVVTRASAQYQQVYGVKPQNTHQNYVEDLEMRLITAKDDSLAKEKENVLLKQELTIMHEQKKQSEQSNNRDSMSLVKQDGGHRIVRPPPTTHFRFLQFLNSPAQKSILSTQTRETCDLLKAIINDHWLAVRALMKLDIPNKEWFPGSDYFLIGDKPIYITSNELGGISSLVFRIKHKGTFFNMEMLLYNSIASNNEISSSSPQIKNSFSSVENYTSCETHRNVLTVRHHFMGSTDRFRKYLKLVPNELPSQTPCIVVDNLPYTLKSFLYQQNNMVPFPVYNLDFRFMFLLLYQILSAVNYLCKNNTFICDMTADQVYIDKHLRPLIGSFRMSNNRTQSVTRTTNQSVPSNSLSGISPSSTGSVSSQSDCIVTATEHHHESLANHVVGRLFYETLCPPPTDVNQSVSLPEHYPPELDYVLRKLVIRNPLHRISTRRAMLTVGMILFPVDAKENINKTDVANHCQARMLKLLALDSELIQKNNETEHVLSIAESIQLVTPEVEADFLYNVTPDEFWDIYEELKAAQFSS